MIGLWAGSVNVSSVGFVSATGWVVEIGLSVCNGVVRDLAEVGSFPVETLEGEGLAAFGIGILVEMVAQDEADNDDTLAAEDVVVVKEAKIFLNRLRTPPEFELPVDSNSCLTGSESVDALGIANSDDLDSVPLISF